MTDDELATIDPEQTPTGGEFALLTGYLDYYRAVMMRKAQGLTREQLAVRLGPSELTIGGLIKHLAWAEDIWFTRTGGGQRARRPVGRSRPEGRSQLGLPQRR